LASRQPWWLFLFTHTQFFLELFNGKLFFQFSGIGGCKKIFKFRKNSHAYAPPHKKLCFSLGIGTSRVVCGATKTKRSKLRKSFNLQPASQGARCMLKMKIINIVIYW
jgi:hypothetical protein